MKSLVIYILLAAAAVGLGLAGGYYACQQNYNAANEGFYNGEYDQEIVDSMSPSLVIEGGYEFDFGKIDSRNKLNRLGEIFFPGLTKP